MIRTIINQPKGETMRSIVFPVAVFLLLPFAAAADTESTAAEDSLFSLSGTIYMGVGQAEKCMYKVLGKLINYRPARTLHHVGFGNPLARLNLCITPEARLKILFGFESRLLLNMFPINLKTTEGTFNDIQYKLFYLHQAQVICSAVNSESMTLNISFGCMPYKYNPEVRNLGEFMFRSTTYPFYLNNDFDFPLARLTGLRVSGALGSERLRFSFDQFVLIERTLPPYGDISLATMAGVNYMKIIDFGVGIDFSRCIPVDNRNTTPKYLRSDFSSPNIGAWYALGNGDTGCYTLKGTKVMARMTIDPCRTLRQNKESVLSGILGENGGKLYGEWAIIGCENYPASFFNFSGYNPYGYDKLKEKMPWMVGVNIPMWKFFDLFAVELEKYPAPYPNDYMNVLVQNVSPVIPVPADPGTAYDSASYRIDRWYWSLYMKKQIFKHFSLIAQIAHDHMKWEVAPGFYQNYDFEDALVKPGEWAWRIGGSLDF